MQNGGYCVNYPSNLFCNTRSFENWGILTRILSSFCWVLLEVANGPLKTLGLAKFSLNFTGLAVSFFLAVMCVSQSRLIFLFKARKVAKYRFVYFFL